MKDFVSTLKTHFLQNGKFEIFMKMAGMYEIMHRPKVDLETFIKRNILQLKLWQSMKVFHLFVTFCMIVKSQKKTLCDYFTPNHEDNNSFLIPVATAILVTEEALKIAGMSFSRIKELSAQIPDVSEKDMFRRMLQKLTVHENEGAK
jgi:hypothetical protein